MNYKEAHELKSSMKLENSSEYPLVCPHPVDDEVGFINFSKDIVRNKFSDEDAKRYSLNGMYSVMFIEINTLYQYRSA